MAATIDDLRQQLPIDLLPVKLFCQIYDRKQSTVRSWKCRYPEIIGVVIFEPDELQMHISISGYESWVTGELKRKIQRARASTVTPCKSGSNGPEAQKPKSTKTPTTPRRKLV